jgi:hypothetical protein
MWRQLTEYNMELQTHKAMSDRKKKLYRKDELKLL